MRAIVSRSGTTVVDIPASDLPDPQLVLVEWRETASLSKNDFITACFDAGILSETAAEEAISGWPASWNAFFNGRSARERIAAKSLWANVRQIKRNAPLMLALQAHGRISASQLDALFGWVE